MEQSKKFVCTLRSCALLHSAGAIGLCGAAGTVALWFDCIKIVYNGEKWMGGGGLVAPVVFCCVVWK